MAGTKALFIVVVVLAVASVAIPVYTTFLGPAAWESLRTRGELPDDPELLVIRMVTSIRVTLGLAAVLLFAALVLFWHRRWVKQALGDREPFVVLAEAAPAANAELDTLACSTLGAEAGQLCLRLNDRSTESYVVSTPAETSIVLSMAHLTADEERRHFVFLHELAHVKHGDARMVGWTQALVRSALTVYCLLLLPLTLLILLYPEEMPNGLLVLAEDLGFALILVMLLWASVELFRQRELDADLRVWWWSRKSFPSQSGAPEEALSHPLWRILRGARFHPSVHERARLARDPSEFLAPRSFLPMSAGIAFGLLGAWGLEAPGFDALPETLSDAELMALVKSGGALLLTYPPRTALLLCGVALVVQDLMRVASRERLLHRVSRAALHFWRGALVAAVIGLTKALLAGLAIGKTLLGLIGLSVISFGYALYLGVLAAILVFFAAQPGHLARPREGRSRAIVPWLPLLLYCLLGVLGVNWFDPANPTASFAKTCGFMLVLLLTAPLLAGLAPRLITGERKSADTHPKRGVQIVALLLGGLLGGIALGIIPVNLIILNTDAAALRNAYPRVYLVLLMTGGIGMLGAVLRLLLLSGKWAVVTCGTALIGLLILFVQPLALNVLVPAISVNVGFCLADRLEVGRLQPLSVRARVLLSAAMGILIGLFVGSLTSILGVAMGASIGVTRTIPGTEGLPQGPLLDPIVLETIRATMDALVGALLTGAGLALAEAVFGVPWRGLRQRGTPTGLLRAS